MFRACELKDQTCEKTRTLHFSDPRPSCLVKCFPELGGRSGYFLFFSARGRGRGSPGRTGTGGWGFRFFLLKIPGGGVFQERVMGWGGATGPGGCLQGDLVGGGGKYFFSGPKGPPRECLSPRREGLDTSFKIAPVARVSARQLRDKNRRCDLQTRKRCGLYSTPKNTANFFESCSKTCDFALCTLKTQRFFSDCVFFWMDQARTFRGHA